MVQHFLIENPSTAANLLKKWDRIIAQAGNSLTVLDDQENTRALAQCLKVNNAACTSIGHPFISQFARIYMDMLGLYKAVSEIISAAVANEGTLFSNSVVECDIDGG